MAVKTNKLLKFLSTCRTQSNTYNFMSLRGGKYLIRDEKFFKLLNQNYVKFSQKDALPLVFRGPRQTIAPFYMDIDFRRANNEFRIPNSTYINMTQEFLMKLKEVTGATEYWDVIITRRVAAYWKEKQKCFADGFHVIIPHLQVTPEIMCKFRTALLADNYWQSFYADYYVINEPKDIIDDAITKRKNGLILLGLNKLAMKNCCCTPHYVMYCDKWRVDWVNNDEPLSYGWQFASKDANTKYLELIKSMYLWALTHDYDQAVPTQPVEIVSSEVQKSTKDITFDLKEFLRVTKGWVPNESDYKQICMFMQTQNLDPRGCNRLCNEAWGYTNEETKRIIDNYDGSQVTRASMIRLLNLYAKEWDESKIFIRPPLKKFSTFNDILDVKNHTWSDSELSNIFRNVFIQTWGENDSRIFYKEIAVQRVGNTNLHITKWVIATSPFAKYDRYVDKTVSKDEMVEFLDELKPNKKLTALQMKTFFKLIEDLKQLPEQELLKEVAVRGMKVTHKSKLSTEFEKCVLNDNLQTFRTFDSEPFLYEDKTPSDTLNIWQRNPLLDYEYKHRVDLTKTRTWHWFHTILCNDDPHKISWLTQYHHEKVCNAKQKIEKLLLFFSEETSTGKSSHQHFFASIAGGHTTIKFDDITCLLKEKNAELLNRLVVYFDDCQRLKKTECEKIKTKVTEKYYMYRRMYEDAVKMNALHDYVLTTNKRNCFHISRENRRIEIIDVNPVMSKCNSEQYWNEWYAERRDPDHNKAWLDHFINFKSSMDVRSKYCRFSQEDLDIGKEASLKISHRFLTELFSTKNFYEMLVNTRRKHDEQYRLAYFHNFTLDETFFIVEHIFLWEMFVHWKKQDGEKNFMKRRTFEQQIKAIGLEKTRIRLRGNDRKWVFKLHSKDILEGIKQYYNFENSVPQVQDEVFLLKEKNNCANVFEVLLSAQVLNENIIENASRREIIENIARSAWVLY